MASGPSETILEDFLSCGICLEPYKKPKILPCAHTFCERCLKAHTKLKRKFSCPHCRRQVILPPEGVKGLGDNFWIGSFRDILEAQRQSLGIVGTGRKLCQEHEGEQLKYFCKGCDVTICSDCIIFNHNQHDVTKIGQVIQKKREEMKSQIEEEKRNLRKFVSKLDTLDMAEKEIHERKHDVDVQIRLCAQRVLDEIEKERDALLGEVSDAATRRIEVISERRKVVQQDLAERMAIIERVNKASAAEDLVEMMSIKDTLKQTGRVAIDEFENDLTIPTLNVGFRALQVPLANFKLGFVEETATDADAGKKNGSPRDSESFLTLEAVAVPNSPMNIQPDGKATQPEPTVPEEVTRQSSGAVGGDTESDDLFHEVESLLLEPVPTSMSVPTRLPARPKNPFGQRGTGDGEFCSPERIAVSEDGDVFVLDCGLQRASIQVFDLNGVFQQRILFEGVNVRAMTFREYEKHIIVLGSSPKESCMVLQEYSKYGYLHRSMRLGIPFLRKADITECPDGNVAIVDENSGNVYIIDQQGRRVATFSADDNPGRSTSCSIATDPTNGNIVVTLATKESVKVFDSYGRFDFEFGSFGNAEGQLYHPTGVCTDSMGNIIVADSGNHQIQMFDSSGRFLRVIASDREKLQWPRAIDLTSDDRVVVADTGACCVFLFPMYFR
ncbi:tripartite motif-containing protein 3-like [Branchiostoma lanceolatum]|uniref:tripartite motif-containing protein 3-like n=1 Tax=Branchiostoma lanceolatum TaxID=7740 RepID=UPI00345549FF